MKQIICLIASLLLFACGTSGNKNTTASEATSKTKSPSANLSVEKIKSLSLATQNRDISKVRELLTGIPKKKSERSPAEDSLVNTALYMATLDGLTCDPAIVDLLEKEYDGLVTKFGAVNLNSMDRTDDKSPLCKEIMAKSLPKMADISGAVMQVHNHYVDLLNATDDQELDKKAAKFSGLLKEASRLIFASCERSPTEPTCAMKVGFLEFADRSKDAKQPAIKRNAGTILKILKR